MKASNQAQSSDQSRQSNPLISVGTQNMVAAWKGFKYGVFSGPNTGEYRPEKTPYLDFFYAVVLNVSVNRLKCIKYANYEKTQTK